MTIALSLKPCGPSIFSLSFPQFRGNSLEVAGATTRCRSSFARWHRIFGLVYHPILLVMDCLYLCHVWDEDPERFDNCRGAFETL